MIANNAAIDNAFGFIIDGICKIFEVIISVLFANKIVAFIIFMIIVNVIAIILIKKDKEYAKTPDARRVRESTLLTVAAAGGAIGEFYAMYKYKHKTLHRKFTLGVPIIMMIHFAILAYNVFYGIIV